MPVVPAQRALRFVFVANVISMLGSGMNSAAVAWYILEATHSEMALGTFALLQTVPAMLMLPFTGVIIDREDRRHLVMGLDAVRAIIIVTVAITALRHHVQYRMGGTGPDSGIRCDRNDRLVAAAQSNAASVLVRLRRRAHSVLPDQ